MSVARSWLCSMVVGFLGCASAPAVEPDPPLVTTPTSPTALQAPAVEKSATPIPSASAPPPIASVAPPAVVPGPSSSDDDDEGEPDIVESGSLSEPQRAIMRGVGRCLERALRRGPGPGGSLALGVSVDADGAVTQLEMGPGYPPAARSCVEASVKNVRFPKEPGAGIRYYRYPINEAPADDADP